MTSAQLGAWLMLVACGLWAGGIMIVAVERTELWRRMPIEEYAVDFRRSVRRVDPLMPILGVLSCVGAALFVAGSTGYPRLLGWAGIGLITLVIVGSIAIAEPINLRFRRLPEGHVPDGAERYRTRWRRFHAARNVVALSAFACLAAAVA